MKFSIDNNYEDGLRKYSTFEYYFQNLTDLYNYLKSNPKVNSHIFRRQSSLTNGSDFAGENLTQAIEYLNGGYNFNFENFDNATRNIRKLGIEDEESTKLERALHGGAYLYPLVAAGVPDCMIRYRQDSDPKHITVYFQLGYSASTTESQIFNRGVATINLIQSLESKGYIVDLKVFELSIESDEIVDITVNLKKTDQLLNVTKCYYPFVSKEFLRRLLFRVLESAPVENDWSNGYGRPASTSEMRDFYKLKDKDLVISQPREMGIDGDNIYTDTITLFKKLGLDNEFDLSKLKEKSKETQKVKTKRNYY